MTNILNAASEEERRARRARRFDNERRAPKSPSEKPSATELFDAWKAQVYIDWIRTL